jgi:xylulokinase
MALYLGFDCSPQNLSAIVIESGDRRRVVFEHTLNFDRDLPEYGTTAGVVPGPGPGERLASPIMWADALDRMMAILATHAEVDIRQIRAISGCAQPHAAVWLNQQAPAVWRGLAHDQRLAPQLPGILTRPLCPTSLDDSAAATIGLTGSRADARFTGSQIRKAYEQDREAYASTTRIHLAGSYLASLLAGVDAPVDASEASATNLFDIRAGQWSAAATDSTAPELALKIPDVRPPWTIVGPLAPYWQSRYAFPPAAVVTWSGELPSALVGTGIVSEGHLAVTFGTSDTACAFTREPGNGATHVYGTPMGGFMKFISFRNGALARDHIRYAHRLDWNQFFRTLDETPPSESAIMLPWLEPETTPRVMSAGLRRFGYDELDSGRDVRAVIEGQMMAIANHAEKMIGQPIKRVVASGEAGTPDAVLQVLADVCDAPVDRLGVRNPACLGAALRALHADRLEHGEPLAWAGVVEGFADTFAGRRVTPLPERSHAYSTLRRRYAELEAVHKDRDPT